MSKTEKTTFKFNFDVCDEGIIEAKNERESIAKGNHDGQKEEERTVFQHGKKEDDDTKLSTTNLNFSFLLPNLESLDKLHASNFENVSLLQDPTTTTDTDNKEKYQPLYKIRQPLLYTEEKKEGFLSSNEQFAKPNHQTTDDGSLQLLRQIKDENSDLISGVYEGGLKLWECSLDLLHYLSRVMPTLSGNFILELGCGHALPACLLLRERIRNNTHQNVVTVLSDFNHFVIEHVTLPNLVRNLQSVHHSLTNEWLAKHVVLAAGDWWQMSSALAQSHEPKDQDFKTKNLPAPLLQFDGQFDIILASETVYTLEACRDTADLLLKHLAPGTGVGYIAAKRYYFGVGGGTDAFRKIAQQATATTNSILSSLRVEVEQVLDTGRANIREILKVRVRHQQKHAIA